MGAVSSALEQIMGRIHLANDNEPEFYRAVREVFVSAVPVVEVNPEYREYQVLERLAEAERIVIFRVPWVDDTGKVCLNRGYRVQMSSVLGPYQGGLTFRSGLTLDALKSLAFEQVFRNSLTGLPLGGAAGGADFNPKGRSDLEIMRFCQAFMGELYRSIGAWSDVVTGGVGVTNREIGFLFGMYKKLSGRFDGGVTNKGTSWGGLRLRSEAAGYGAIYFVEAMLARRNEIWEDKTLCLSGSGIVAQNAAAKALEMGAKVLTMSDSHGFIYDPDGIDEEKLGWIAELKNQQEGKLSEYVKEFSEAEYYEGQRPWQVPCDIAIPAACQNELFREDALQLIANGTSVVAEAADLPCVPEAVEELQRARLLYAPSKAVGAGGVAATGFEMSQNAAQQSWCADKTERHLQQIVRQVHEVCARYGRSEHGLINYLRGANVAAFVRVADALVDQGIV